ncbi:MAG: acyltransferase domain-containing protein, partial [Bdellovibrionota bacterium]
QKALADSRVAPDTIQYVEAHGTATLIGDPIEIEALTRAYTAGGPLQRGTCGIGSVKSNIGHTTTAAGVIGLIKTVLSLQNQILLPTLHFQKPNPRLDIENSPFFIVDQLAQWPAGNVQPRRAAVSSFGLGGTNSHLIVQEAPKASVRTSSAPDLSRPFEIFPVSARTSAQRDQLLEQIVGESAIPRDIAHTLQIGRGRHKYRAARIRFSNDALEDLLVGASGGATRLDDASDSLGFLFPGQGSQYVGMGKILFESLPEYRRHFSECCAVLDQELELNFRQLVFVGSPEETLEKTQFTQPALFATEYALGRTLLDWGIRPTFLIGHSVGEFVAATLAGVFTLSTGLKLISARGRFMAALPAGKMLSVRAPIADVQAVVGSDVDVASINSPFHCVLAGPESVIAHAQSALERAGFASRFLHTSHAFHSAMMDPAVEPFLAIAQKLFAMSSVQAPSIPIFSTVTGAPLSDVEAQDPRYWAAHLRKTVRFSHALSTAIDQGGTTFMEVGPRAMLATLAQQQLKCTSGIAIPLLGDQPDAKSELGGVATALARLWVHAGREIPWERIWLKGKRVALHPHPFSRKPFRFSENRNPEIQTQKPIVSSLQAMSNNDESGIPEPGYESELSQLFSEFSGTIKIEPDAGFFELGFDSLLLIQLGVEIGKRYGVSISLRELTEEASTLRRLSAFLTARRELGSAPVSAKGPKPGLLESGPHARTSHIVPPEEDAFLAPTEVDPSLGIAITVHNTFTKYWRRMHVDAICAYTCTSLEGRPTKCRSTFGSGPQSCDYTRAARNLQCVVK